MVNGQRPVATRVAARRVIRGIYGEELEAFLKRKGRDIDDRMSKIPRFGGAKYRGLSDEALLHQFRQRVESASADSRLVKQRGKLRQNRLEQIVALAEDDCETWVRDVYRDVCSNPNPERNHRYRLLGEPRARTASYGSCNHMFTLLLDWDQVTNWLLLPMQWLNSHGGGVRLHLRDAPAAPTNSELTAAGAPAALLCVNRLSAADRQRGDMVATFAAAAARAVSIGQNRWSCCDNPVWGTLRSRLELPFHASLNDGSVFNTLTYLWNHMKCGVYIKIRQNKLAMFVPFQNLDYRNAWAEAAGKHLPGGREFGQSLEEYYAEKRAILSDVYRHEDILSDISHWWANGNILCNEPQVCNDFRKNAPFWGDQHLPQMKDMIQQTCLTRAVKDCDFFLNKRDYPQLKSDLSEPYDFLYEEEQPPLPREKHATYAPILSYYTSPEFADIPFPCGEDWMAAIGDFFPPKATPNFMKDNSDNFGQKVERAAQAAGKTPWEIKKATAIFRGSGTGGGNMPDDNQRLMLHKLSEDWKSDPRYNSRNRVDGMPYLDASCTQWNFRDKKLKGHNMTFFDPHVTGNMTKGNFVPMFEQVMYKYHIYAEGHCAANRYAQMMRSGCVIIKVASGCKASELWFFPALVPYQDHVPVKADLSDLAEQIEWCKSHDQECRQIATRSRELHSELFSEEGIKDYCALTFNEISHRFSKGQRSHPQPCRFKEKIPAWTRRVTGATGLKPGDHGRLQIPAGWLECHEAGMPLLIDDNLLVLACKAPLGEHFGRILEPGSRFSPADIVTYMRVRYSREVGLVINLSSTEKLWYSRQDWPSAVDLVHLACETLDGKAINAFCWEISKYRKKEEARRLRAGSLPRSIVVHCTDGHNRTGFMLCAYMLAACEQWNAINHTVQQVVAEYARVRPPGIYNADVLASLHRLYCEQIPENYPCPTPPRWAQVYMDRPPSGTLADAVASVPDRNKGRKMEHDDTIGEEVPEEMVDSICQQVYKLVTGTADSRAGFPGNHPVNLTRGTMPYLNQQHCATWKADGTRYLMLIKPEGSFLVSRNATVTEKVRRVQIRCPRSDGHLHFLTLLDGELVVDTDPETKQQKRRFYVFDILSSGSNRTRGAPQRFTDRPFKERSDLISTEFVNPYDLYRRGKLFGHRYDRSLEEFTIRRKIFVPLERTEHICRTIIPTLGHEADGLIFQPVQAVYRTGACSNLFKWKFPWLNSVDFFLQDGQLHLGGDSTGHGKKLMPDMRVIIDPTLQGQPGQPAPVEWPYKYNRDTIECVWVNLYLLDPKHGTAARAAGLRPDGMEGNGLMQLRMQMRTWVFLRHRAGKGANGEHTYDRILESVVHPITQEELITFCNKIALANRPSNFDVQNQEMIVHYDRVTDKVRTRNADADASLCSKPLRLYHNDVKRKLIARFGHGARGAKVLDLAAGQGGDLSKWQQEQGPSFLLGLDLSQNECNEANQRFNQMQKAEMQNHGRIGSMQAHFRRETLGHTVREFYTEVGHPAERFAVVSCMFAFHYFFADHGVLRTLFETVSANLCEDGIFLGCLPDGQKIKECIEQSANGGVFKNSVLTIKKKWKGKAAPFGSNYSFAIADTVTDKHDDDGSEEPLAMMGKFVEQMAEKAGLEVLSNYSSTASLELSQAGRELEVLLDPADVQRSFKHFAPKFGVNAQRHGLNPQTAADLAVASAVNATFVFRKVVIPRALAVPVGGAREFLASNRMKTCGATPSVAIIVCFRIQKGQRREAELEEFLPHMRTMLEKLRAAGEIKKFHIFVIQQRGCQDLDGIKFNRGKLLNIGFEITQQDFDSFVFHDVDLLPNDDLAPYYACVPTTPIHIAACWHERGYTNNPAFFGGIVSFSKMDFLSVNGYPNNFWGWGGEDEVIMDRCTRQRIVPYKVTEGSLTDIEKNAEGKTMGMDAKLAWLKQNAHWKCGDRWERREKDSRTWGMNGVATLHEADQSYIELLGQRQDVSELGAGVTANNVMCKQLEGTQLGCVATRIVVDLLFDKGGGAERRDPRLEHAMHAKKRKHTTSRSTATLVADAATRAGEASGGKDGGNEIHVAKRSCPPG